MTSFTCLPEPPPAHGRAQSNFQGTFYPRCRESFLPHPDCCDTCCDMRCDMRRDMRCDMHCDMHHTKTNPCLQRRCFSNPGRTNLWNQPPTEVKHVWQAFHAWSQCCGCSPFTLVGKRHMNRCHIYAKCTHTCTMHAPANVMSLAQQYFETVAYNAGMRRQSQQLKIETTMNLFLRNAVSLRCPRN